MSSKTRALSEKIGHLDVPKAVCVEPGSTLDQVYAAMQKQGVGCVLVCKGQSLQGIFTDRDVAMKTLAVAPGSTPVSAVMTAGPVTVTADATVGDAVELMHGKGFRNLPVVDARGKVAGLLSVRHIIKYLAAQFPAEVYNLPPKPDQVDSASEGA